MTPSERSYRRYVRLLPAGFRQRWEEDMVNAYLERAEAGHSTVGERLSLVAQAVRTWLSGAGASPRRLEWYRAAQTVALLVLLRQAVLATQIVASTVDFWVVWGLHPTPDLLWRIVHPLWIAAFLCLVLGRRGSARVLAVLAAGVTIAQDVVAQVTRAEGEYVLYVFDDPRLWLWAAIAVLAVFVGPADFRPARWRWLSAFAVAAALLVAWTLTDRPLPGAFWVLDGDAVGKVLLAVGALTLLAVVAVRRARAAVSPRWLFALAALAIVVGVNGVLTNRIPDHIFAIVALVDSGEGIVLGPGEASHTLSYWLWTGANALDPVLLALAGLCAIVGLILLRRLPGRHEVT